MMDPTGMMSLHQDTRFFVVPHVDGCLVYVQFMGLELVYGWLGARKLGYGWKKMDDFDDLCSSSCGSADNLGLKLQPHVTICRWIKTPWYPCVRIKMGWIFMPRI
jgi:hypothetical protein